MRKAKIEIRKTPRHFWPLLTCILARMAALERQLASIARAERKQF